MRVAIKKKKGYEKEVSDALEFCSELFCKTTVILPRIPSFSSWLKREAKHFLANFLQIFIVGYKLTV